MKNILNIKTAVTALLIGGLFTGCKTDDDTLQVATYDANGEVFIDTFSTNLVYASFGTADVTAFDVDTEVTYNNTARSMKFAIPNKSNATGSYAGGSFFTSVPRDLSSFNCLTFYAKASNYAKIDLIGFGNDFGANKFQTTLSNVEVNSNWQKIIIPIPDPSKLTEEKGMLIISDAPEGDAGYTLWLDEVQFENLPDLNPAKGIIEGGVKNEVSLSTGVTHQLSLQSVSNLPNGTNLTMDEVKAAYFTFTSSNPSVATVDTNGLVTVVGEGTATITATLNGTKATGSLVVTGTGNFIFAPVPTLAAADVISIFSDVYTNHTVDFYNGYWEPYQNTTSADFTVNGDNILSYANFNFVGIQFSTPTVDASQMTHFHADIFFPGTGILETGAMFQIELVDFGADGVQGGSDDTTQLINLPAADIINDGSWKSIDAALTLSNKAHLGQIILKDLDTGKVTDFYLDNVYFHK